MQGQKGNKRGVGLGLPNDTIRYLDTQSCPDFCPYSARLFNLLNYRDLPKIPYVAQVSQSWFLLLASVKCYNVQCYKQSLLSGLVVDYSQGGGRV